MALKSTYYQDSLYHLKLLAEIENAKALILIATFLFRTDYVGDTRVQEILDALDRAIRRGVRVLVVLNYSRFEPDVCQQNYATAEKLIALGCEVRLGPPNQTFHSKIVVIDYARAFVGSHNFTRGALSFNREFTHYTEVKALVNRAGHYFNELWYAAIPFAQVTPGTTVEPIELSVVDVTTDEAAINLTFEVNHTNSQSSPTGVDAFAALAGTRADLVGATLGAAVSPTERVATVVPAVDSGTTIYVGVRAYTGGQAIATSRSVQLVYQPTETPPGDGEDGGGGGGDTPPPEPLTAPTLTSLIPASPTEVTASWQFVGHANFLRFEIQRRDIALIWVTLGIVMDATARQWTGEAIGTIQDTPFRVVVFTSTESAASNVVSLTGEMPVTAPVLGSVEQSGATTVTATWTFNTPVDFHRFELHQRTNGTWQTLATIMDGTTRSWDGAPSLMDATHPIRLVVFNMTEQSAASNEMTITLLSAIASPVLTTLYRVGAMGLHVDWTVTAPQSFDRFELQQRQTDGVTWTAFATVTSPTARSWEGNFVPYRDTTHPVRVVVFDTFGQSAASNEVAIAGPDAPHIESVATASGTTVRVQWTWSGLDFQSYIVQQQDAQQTWQDLAQLFPQTPMQWTGTPNAMQAGRPFRVVVNAGTPSPVAVNSNEVSLVAGPPPAPALGLITPGVLPTVHVPWTWAGALNFASFVIQQRNGTMVWQDLATITNPATVDWTGQMLMAGQSWPFRLVVHLTTGESAMSAEGYVTQG